MFSAFKPVAAAFFGALGTLGTTQRAQILALTHEYATAPGAAQIMELVQAAIPEVRILGVDLSGPVIAALPGAQASLTAALDGESGLLLSWLVTGVQKVAARLAE